MTRPATRPLPASLPLAALLLVAGGFQGARASEVPDASGALADPGSYSLAPATPAAASLPGSPLAAPLAAGGVASTSFGSNGYRSTGVELDSGLIGGNSRAFVAVGAGQGPRWHDTPGVSGQSFAAGVSTALPFGTTLSVSAGVDRTRFGRSY